MTGTRSIPGETDRRIVRIAELEIEPDFLDEYMALLAEEIEASVAMEPGVLALHAVSIEDAPTEIRILEIYADRQSYEAHLTTPHFLKYKTSTAGMVRSLRLVETRPIRLGSKAGPTGA